MLVTFGLLLSANRPTSANKGENCALSYTNEFTEEEDKSTDGRTNEGQIFEKSCLDDSRGVEKALKRKKKMLFFFDLAFGKWKKGSGKSCQVATESEKKIPIERDSKGGKDVENMITQFSIIQPF